MGRIALAVALALATAAIVAGSAGSATSTSEFLVFVEPTVTAASTGLTIETELAGSFIVANKEAHGDGMYSLMAGSTVLDSGTFTLTGLVAFQFYGCGEVTADGVRI